MSDLQVRGPIYGGSGSPAPFTAGGSGAQRVMDAHGRYMEATFAGRGFTISVAAGAATAYTGGAAGTPLLCVHNPANSGKLISLLAASVGGRVAASAAGTVGFNIWAGPSVLPTGTTTPAVNTLSLAGTGSVARAFINTALTGSTALTNVFPLGTYYWATAAGAFVAPLFFDLTGLITLAPGNQAALGGTAALTSATYDAMLFWEELPYLP